MQSSRSFLLTAMLVVIGLFALVHCGDGKPAQDPSSTSVPAPSADQDAAAAEPPK